MTTLAHRMQKEIEHVRKEAHVAISKLEDELRRERQMAGEKVAEIARLNERIKQLEGSSRLDMMLEESRRHFLTGCAPSC